VSTVSGRACSGLIRRGPENDADSRQHCRRRDCRGVRELG
jgi:hypothetical protein